MQTTIVLPILAFGLLLTGGAAVNAMPVTVLEQAAPAAATQVYHRGRPHRPARVTVYPRYAPVPYFADMVPLVRSSHERFDGRGYPDGLTGGDIPLGSRVIAVCDAFHAMTEDRVYRKALSLEGAVTFGRDVVVRGTVRLEGPKEIPDGEVLSG